MKRLNALMTAMLTLMSLTACAGQSLPNPALAARPQLRAQSSTVQKDGQNLPPMVFGIDKTELHEDVNGQQYGFDHLIITHRNAYAYHQDSIHMAYRRDHAVLIYSETRGLHLPEPESEHYDLSDHDTVLRVIDRLQVLKPRNAQQKAHIDLAIRHLRNNLSGVGTR
ncbi:MAG: hypothetical protein ACAI44_10485 [Candidatus Sericytochromatia bacterium]